MFITGGEQLWKFSIDRASVTPVFVTPVFLKYVCQDHKFTHMIDK
jgi:hypothetical protein